MSMAARKKGWEKKILLRPSGKKRTEAGEKKKEEDEKRHLSACLLSGGGRRKIRLGKRGNSSEGEDIGERNKRKREAKKRKKRKRENVVTYRIMTNYSLFFLLHLSGAGKTKSKGKKGEKARGKERPSLPKTSF